EASTEGRGRDANGNNRDGRERALEQSGKRQKDRFAKNDAGRDQKDGEPEAGEHIRSERSALSQRRGGEHEAERPEREAEQQQAFMPGIRQREQAGLDVAQTNGDESDEAKPRRDRPRSQSTQSEEEAEGGDPRRDCTDDLAEVENRGSARHADRTELACSL